MPSRSLRPLHVDSRRAGQRLDLVLVDLLGWSRTRVQRLIKDGAVLVDGEPATKPGRLLEAGERVELARTELTVATTERAASPPVAILHEDEHLIVVDKPAGVVVHGTPGPAGRLAGTVCEQVGARFGPLPEIQGAGRPGVVHRLDRGTSGVLVLGRTEAALAELKRQFREREVEKRYLALVHGDPRFDSDWIELAVGRSKRHPDRMTVRDEWAEEQELTEAELEGRALVGESGEAAVVFEPRPAKRARRGGAGDGASAGAGGGAGGSAGASAGGAGGASGGSGSASGSDGGAGGGETAEGDGAEAEDEGLDGGGSEADAASGRHAPVRWREARTFYEVRERFGDFAWVACRPLTGRTHQIRVHLSALGHPLVADSVYRARGAQRAPWPVAAPPLARHALHAAALELTHPATGERVRFESPLPADLAAALAWLRARSSFA